MPNPSRFDPHVHGTRTDSHGDPSGVANLPAEEPYALMRARTGLREPWRATARATRPDARKAPDFVDRGEVAHQSAGPLDQLLPDVRFASHPSARRKTAA